MTTEPAIAPPPVSLQAHIQQRDTTNGIDRLRNQRNGAMAQGKRQAEGECAARTWGVPVGAENRPPRKTETGGEVIDQSP